MGTFIKDPNPFVARTKPNPLSISGLGVRMGGKRAAEILVDKLIKPIQKIGSYIDEPLRATILHGTLAHSRGKLHFKRISHSTYYDPQKAAAAIHAWDLPQDRREALAYQEKILLKMLESNKGRRINAVARIAKYGGRWHCGKFCLGEQEEELVRYVIECSGYYFNLP